MEFTERLEESLTLDVTRIYGLGNRSGPTLGFGINIHSPRNTQHISAITINGSLSVQTAQGPEIHLGELKRWETSSPPYPICISPNSDTQADFVLDISWDALGKIEKFRAGGEITVKGGLTILFVETPATPNEGKTVKRMFWANGTLMREHRNGIIIHRAEWLEALAAWGYANKRVLEIDIPSLDIFKNKYVVAYTHLQAAITKTWEGDYRHVLTECRLCLDNLEELFNAHIAELESDDGNDIRKQKIEKLYKAVRQIGDIGPHKGQPSNRTEAFLCLSITRELLAYLGQQRCAHKA